MKIYLVEEGDYSPSPTKRGREYIGEVSSMEEAVRLVGAEWGRYRRYSVEKGGTKVASIWVPGADTYQEIEVFEMAGKNDSEDAGG